MKKTSMLATTLVLFGATSTMALAENITLDVGDGMVGPMKTLNVSLNQLKPGTYYGLSCTIKNPNSSSVIMAFRNTFTGGCPASWQSVTLNGKSINNTNQGSLNSNSDNQFYASGYKITSGCSGESYTLLLENTDTTASVQVLSCSASSD